MEEQLAVASNPFTWFTSCKTNNQMPNETMKMLSYLAHRIQEALRTEAHRTEAQRDIAGQHVL